MKSDTQGELDAEKMAGVYSCISALSAGLIYLRDDLDWACGVVEAAGDERPHKQSVARILHAAIELRDASREHQSITQRQFAAAKRMTGGMKAQS